MGQIKERTLGISFSKQDNEVVAEATDMVLSIGSVANKNPKIKFVVQMTDTNSKITMSFTKKQFEKFSKSIAKFMVNNNIK